LKLFATSALLIGVAAAATAQTEVPRIEPLLDQGFSQMYNLKFDDAHRTFAEYQRLHPNDPLGPVSDAAAWLFSEFERLHILRSEFALSDSNFFASQRALPADPTAKKNFDASLQKTQQLAEPGLKRNPQDPDALFATALRLGLHADFEALIEKKSLAALAEIKQARMEADKLLMSQPEYYDGYIAGALENYLLSLKPAPVRWILHATGAQTDRQTGLDKLRITAERGHYLLPYARLLMAIAALRDHRPEETKQGLQWLSAHYPGNKLYREELEKLK
jgi:hypothetical protein